MCFVFSRYFVIVSLRYVCTKGRNTSSWMHIRCSVNIHAYIICSINIHACIRCSVHINAYVKCSALSGFVLLMAVWKLVILCIRFHAIFICQRVLQGPSPQVPRWATTARPTRSQGVPPGPGPQRPRGAHNGSAHKGPGGWQGPDTPRPSSQGPRGALIQGHTPQL